jgi:hypothetical protein
VASDASAARALLTKAFVIKRIEEIFFLALKVKINGNVRHAELSYV